MKYDNQVEHPKAYVKANTSILLMCWTRLSVIGVFITQSPPTLHFALLLAYLLFALLFACVLLLLPRFYYSLVSNVVGNVIHVWISACQYATDFLSDFWNNGYFFHFCAPPLLDRMLPWHFFYQQAVSMLIMWYVCVYVSVLVCVRVVSLHFS